MCKNRIIKLFVAALVAAATAVIDRVTKAVVADSMALGEQIEFIPGVLRWTYIQNKGAAFGSLSNARWVFMIASCILIVAICVYLIKARKLNWLSCVSLSLILGGGIGNMIDRIMLGYVVDFIDFYPIPFWRWIFNVADSCVCIGAVLFVIAYFFTGKNEKNGK